MHDILEGVCKYELADVLHYSIYTAEIIDAKTLNNRICGFDFGQNCKRNIPPDILPGSIRVFYLKMSSAETACTWKYLFVILYPQVIPCGMAVEDV